jgi:hypothetical protein
VENALKPFSWTPVRVRAVAFCHTPVADLLQNAFSSSLGPFGFDFHQMLVPDLLHEFELGVFKNVFVHLIRLLYAFGQELVIELNRR